MKEDIKIIISILIGLLILPIGLYLSNIQYQYDYEKCSNFRSGESSYDFTNRIEVNAEVNDRCYYLLHHPLAKIGYIIIPIVFSFMAILSFIFISVMSESIKGYNNHGYY